MIVSKTLTDWQPSLADLRVLVVDDEPDASELIAAVLMGRGTEVVSIESAGEALGKWSDNDSTCWSRTSGCR